MPDPPKAQGRELDHLRAITRTDDVPPVGRAYPVPGVTSASQQDSQLRKRYRPRQ